MSRARRAADALGAMYFVAAVLLGVGAVVVIALMFVPSGFLSRAADRWIPGSTPGYEGPAPASVTPEQRQSEEDLHIH
jgi:hypothetical protein